MTVLVTFFISCRFYCRTVLIYTLGYDDWVMLAAAVSAFIIGVGAGECNILMTAGIGRGQ